MGTRSFDLVLAPRNWSFRRYRRWAVRPLGSRCDGLSFKRIHHTRSNTSASNRENAPAIIKLTVVAYAIHCLVLVAGCDKSTNHASPGEASASASTAQSRTEKSYPASPIETVEQVRRLRQAAQFEELERLIDESQSRSVINLIQAVDRLAHANRVLQSRVIEHYGSATARRFDRSEITNAPGVFSLDVKTVSERIAGQRATVTYQVADRLPLQQVALIQTNGRWLIETDAPIPGIADELRRLADVLTWAARRLDHRHISADQLDAELRARQAAIGRRLAELTDSKPQKP